MIWLEPRIDGLAEPQRSILLALLRKIEALEAAQPTPAAELPENTPWKNPEMPTSSGIDEWWNGLNPWAKDAYKRLCESAEEKAAMPTSSASETSGRYWCPNCPGWQTEWHTDAELGRSRGNETRLYCKICSYRLWPEANLPPWWELAPEKPWQEIKAQLKRRYASREVSPSPTTENPTTASPLDVEEGMEAETPTTTPTIQPSSQSGQADTPSGPAEQESGCVHEPNLNLIYARNHFQRQLAFACKGCGVSLWFGLIPAQAAVPSS